MDHFHFREGVLHVEDVPLPAIAEAVGTPVYIYSRATLVRHARVFREALAAVPGAHLAFAVKSNPNLAVLKVLQKEGYGADVVSGGELERALRAGMAPADIVFSGVGKNARELERGLDAGIGQFNIESEEEGRELAEIAGSARGGDALEEAAHGLPPPPAPVARVPSMNVAAAVAMGLPSSSWKAIARANATLRVR